MQSKCYIYIGFGLLLIRAQPHRGMFLIVYTVNIRHNTITYLKCISTITYL